MHVNDLSRAHVLHWNAVISCIDQYKDVLQCELNAVVIDVAIGYIPIAMHAQVS